MAILRDLWNGAFAVGGAGGVSQGPAFLQQYMQRLGGTIDGMKRAAESLEQVPAQLQLQIQTLQAHEAALLAASPLTRPYVFLKTVDQRVLDGTVATFEPALPLTTEALVYAVIGMFLAVLLGGVLAWLIAFPFRRSVGRPRRRQDPRPHPGGVPDDR
ncbi:MAG: DUF2937 family protein [Sneathiellaceae bacterium]